MKSKAGFTLIEIMVSLVLVGLIASIAGTAVVMGTRGYLFARENDAITQKAQLALGRLNREFIELSNVKAVNDSQPYLIYEVPSRVAGVLAERRAVAKVGNAVQMFFNVPGTDLSGLTGDTLIDGVQSFSIRYNPNPGSTASLWSMGQGIRNLFAVNVQLVLARPDTGGTVSFYSTVSPRNNNNSGGAALPTTSNPPPEYSGKQCFVTTAAYGDADHPVVEVLRQFRDRALLPTEPGKALVRYYYEAGPSLAAAIEDKPIACLLVRLLVTPLAGFAFLALFCPVLIPVILFLSWGLARLALRVLERRSLRWTSRLQGQRGAMLVTLIATMVVFSTLGAIMVGMFGTSALSQASGSHSLKAYYLAESGFRYAASRYIGVNMGSESANEAARDNLLETELHGKTFSLAPGDGGFRIDAYPYYYKVTEIPSSNQLRTRVTGGFPLEGTSYNNGSWVQVKKTDGSPPLYVQISGVSTHTYAGYNEVRFWTFSGGNWDSTIDVGATVTPVSVPDRTALTATDGDGDGLLDFIPFVASSGAAAFPARNGIFTVTVMEGGSPKSRTLSYRELDITNRRLKGIGDPNGLPLTSLTLKDPQTILSPQNFIELTKFIRLESTGTIGTGSAAVSRTVTYYTPIGSTRAEQAPKTQFRDTMENFANWRTGDDIGRIGTLRAGTSYGTTMRVDTTQVVNQAPGVNCLMFREFQAGLNWSGAGIPIQAEWLRAGNYLSYDLEVKAYYTLTAQTAKHALGLTFRLDEAGNALGFTYARGVPGGGDQTGACDNDGIPRGWLGTISGYTDYTPVLLFWMKEYARKESGTQETKIVTSPCVANPTTIDDPPKCGRADNAISANRTDWQNGDRVRFTNASGALPPPLIAGKDYFIRRIVYASTTYLYLFSNEVGALGVPFDANWPGLVNITGTGSGTMTLIAQDPTFTKLAHQVMDSGNEYYKIFSSSLHLLHSWVTFMTRVIEAPSVSFVSGGGSSGREILNGETVYQTADNLPGGTVTAKYKVARNPVYRESSASLRNWAGNAAQGVILLERIQGDPASNPSTSPFTAGRKIFVGEHPGGTWAATVGVPGGYTDQAFRARDNWVMFFVGDPTATLPADTDPFNNFRDAIFRSSFLWPPDSVEDTAVNNDRFTLLRFEDYVNTTYVTAFGTKNNLGNGGDVLRFTSPDGSMFYSPQSGVVFPVNRSEVGLHAYGNDGNSVEYDDFGLQFGPGPGPSRKGFLMPIQQ